MDESATAMDDHDNDVPGLNQEHLLRHLAEIEAFGETQGWNHPPVLLAITNEPVPDTTDEWRLAARSVDVPSHVWSDTGNPTEVLSSILAVYRSPHAQAVAVLDSHDNPYTRNVGWAFVYIKRSTYGDEVRVVDAADAHGRLYRIARLRGATPEGEFDNDGSTFAETPTHRILGRLVDATRL
ncbi:hypothetical protein [Plantactinospora endophytica]|uniref:Uncharacterized protein n=1 Tax=Plantactinospora endophytica TaxID=673535 RepID=A0ABQ4DWY8_9ACTN|nr:hypothetical protein [Plantactinospora endophytica]GIG86948.1 hypothetical protein Pen02_18840 [Plantactinospora endophytica]